MMIDFHCDTLMRLHQAQGKKNLLKNDFHVDIEKMKRGGSIAQFFAIFIENEEVRRVGRDPWKTAIEMKDIFYKEIEKNSEHMDIALSYSDYKKNKEEGKISGILTIEEGGIIENNIDRVKELYDGGIRLITLVWNYQNSIGAPSCIDQERGLTPFGKEVVQYMEHLGMIVDISHLSDGGVQDLKDICKKPFIASHSNARDVCDVWRNLKDSQIKDIGNRGGIIGLNYCPAFVTKEEISSVDGLVRHISHMINKGGEDVIALGSDFDGISGSLEIGDIGETYKLVEQLRKSGYKERMIEKILFKNGERIIKELL